MGEYNPDRPYVVGMQWAPLLADAVLLDTATEVGYTFRALADYEFPDGLQRVRVLTTTPPPGQPERKELVVNLYRADQVGGTGPLRKLVIPCGSGSLQAGATLGGGATSVQAAVQNPSDARHVALTGPNAFCRFWFAVDTAQVTAALRHRRILDVTVLYAVSGPLEVAPGAVTVGLERPSGTVNWVMADTLAGPATQTAAVVPRRVRLGELNPWWNPTAAPVAGGGRLPWHLASSLDVASAAGLTAWAGPGGSSVNVRLSTGPGVPAGTVFQVHYLAVEVTYGEENRVGGGGVDLSTGAQPLDGMWMYEVPVVALAPFGYPVELRRKVAYAVTVGQAYAGQLSVASPVPLRVDRLGDLHPAGAHRGVVLRKTLTAGTVPAVDTVAQMPALVAFAGPPAAGVPEAGCHAYIAQAVGTVNDRYPPTATTQTVVDDAAGVFVWARFYARHLPGTRAPLRLTQVTTTDPGVPVGPRAEIGVDDVDALPELADGWREVTLRLDPPAVLTGGGAPTRWAFSSAADGQTPWQVLGADHNPGSLTATASAVATYGGEQAAARLDNQPDLSADLCLMLAREMDPVTGLAVDLRQQALSHVDADCSRPDGGVVTGLHYHQLAWEEVNTATVGGWGCYELQRHDDTMPAQGWETIARITEPTVTGMDDYEARVGVVSRYRIRMVHRTGIAGPWSTPVTSPTPAPGVTGTAPGAGLLILTSNHHADGNLACAMSFDRRGAEEFTFPEAGQVDLLPMYGRDYRIAARPVERGGVEFTRTVLVNTAAVPPAALDAGFRGLRDLAWDTVPYVCVRDELGNRWLATILVPGGSVRRRTRGQLQLAQLTVVEVTDSPAPVGGGPARCDGLRTEGAVETVTAETPTPPTLAPLIVQDTFTRQETAGWGQAGDGPVMRWTVLQGPAQDLAVGLSPWGGHAGAIRVAQFRNSNPFAADSATGWTATGGTVVRSTAQSREGGASLLLTPTGTTATVRVESDTGVGVSVGVQWRAGAWVRCAVARTIVIGITWHDDTGTARGHTAGAPVPVPANTWTWLSHTATPADPAATRAAMTIAMDGTPPAAHLLHLDEAGIGPAPTPKTIVVGPELTDVDVRAQVALDTLAQGQPVDAYLLGRDNAGTSHYRARLAFNATGTLSVGVERVDAGVVTRSTPLHPVTDAADNPVTYAQGSPIWLRLQIRGPMVQATAWTDGTGYTGWPARLVDTTGLGPGRTGVRAGVPAGNTNVTATMRVANLVVRRPIRDVDIRVQMRATADQWSAVVAHYSLSGPNTVSSGWSAEFDDRNGCFEVFGGDVFFECTETEGRTLAARQRGWLRATYRLDPAAGVATLHLYTSLDGLAWRLLHTTTGPPEPFDADDGFFAIDLSDGVTVSRIQIHDGVDGPILADPDFAAAAPGTTRLADGQGNVWAVSGRGICANT